MNKASELVEALDSELKRIAATFSSLFQDEFGNSTTGDDLRIFMEKHRQAISQSVAAANRRQLMIVAMEGVDQPDLLIDHIRRSKAYTVSQLWRQIGAIGIGQTGKRNG